jgi:hypothetical protein
MTLKSESSLDLHPTMGNHHPANTRLNSRPASPENLQFEVLHPTESSAYTELTRGRPLQLPHAKQSMWTEPSMFYGVGPKNEGAQRELEEVPDIHQHGALDHSIPSSGGLGSGSLEFVPESLSSSSEHAIRESAPQQSESTTSVSYGETS